MRELLHGALPLLDQLGRVVRRLAGHVARANLAAPAATWPDVPASPAARPLVAACRDGRLHVRRAHDDVWCRRRAQANGAFRPALARRARQAPTPDRGARGGRQFALERPPPPHQLTIGGRQRWIRNGIRRLGSTTRAPHLYAAEGSVKQRGGQQGRLLANRAIARDDTPRSAAHATRASSTSAAPAQRIVPMPSRRPLHFGRYCSRMSVTFSFQSSRVVSSSHSEYPRLRTCIKRTHLSAPDTRASSVRHVYARRKRSSWVPERRASATLDLDVVGVHTARAPLASQAQYVGLRRHCSASHRLRGAQPACQRRRAGQRYAGHDLQHRNL